MSLGDDLLDAIVRAPDDPAARLVYADHRLGFSANDPHAELIIVQERLAELEATRLWRDTFSSEAQSLRDREKKLVASLEEKLDLPAGLATWRRGFVDRLALDFAAPANLAKRIDHPVFRVVRALHFRSPDIPLSPILANVRPTVRRIEGNFSETQRYALDAITEMRVPIERAVAATRDVARLERLELTEGELERPSDVRRELAWGYRAARRAAEAAAQELADAQRDRLVDSFDKLPAVTHLVLETTAPLEPAVLSALSRYRGCRELVSLRLHAGHDRAGKLLVALGAPYSNVRFDAILDSDREIAAKAEVNLAEVDMHHSRAAEAANRYDDAHCFCEGRYPGIVPLYERAARAAGATRQLTDPDPARDGLLHRVPALLRWGQIDRVLAVAPNHAGAWALDGFRHRDDFELDEAEEAFARALEDEADGASLAKAYAIMLEDAPAALAILNHVAPSAHANVLFACVQALQSQPEIALGLLRDSRDSFARLAVGLLERQCGRNLRGRETWQELVHIPEGETSFERWVITFFAATLASAEPYQKRRAFHDWLATTEPRRPIAALLFDPLIRVANKVMPQVDATMVSREVDRLRGA